MLLEGSNKMSKKTPSQDLNYDDRLEKAIEASGGYEWTPGSPWPPQLPKEFYRNEFYHIKAKMIDDYLFGDTDKLDL